MKVYNQYKTKILEDYDLSLGYLKQDYINIPEVKAVKEKGHYEIIAEYPETGGKDLEWVVDVEGVEYQPSKKEEIFVYIPYTSEELELRELNNLRRQREDECFAVINRGKLWYDTLTDEQIYELRVWYRAWLDVTDTKVVPKKPEWLK